MIPKDSGFKKKHADRMSPVAFRKAVWDRDGGRCRATGQRLERGQGDVAHLKCRRVRPDWKTDPDRAILLSAEMHRLSDARGNNRLTLADLDTGLAPEDARKLIRFTLRDRDGRVVWSVVR